MSHARELKNAQGALIEAVGGLVDELRRIRHGGHSETWPIGIGVAREVLMPVFDAFNAYEALANDLNAAGASSARDTSIAAGHTALPTKGSLRGDVIALVCSHYGQWRTGLTTSELEARLRRSHQSVSSAVNYADGHGWIKDSGERRPTQFKRQAIVWIPTEKARTTIVTDYIEARVGGTA